MACVSFRQREDCVINGKEPSYRGQRGQGADLPVQAGVRQALAGVPGAGWQANLAAHAAAYYIKLWWLSPALSRQMI